MKIEVGKFYKTRNGSKVRIYATDAGGQLPTHGAVINDKNDWISCTFSVNGRYFSSISSSDLDLVSEWEEPKPRLLAYMRKGTRTIHLFDETNNTSFEGWIRVPHLDEPEIKE